MPKVWFFGGSKSKRPRPVLKLFPWLAALAGLLGYFAAEHIAIARPAIVPLLMLVMLSMGLTLSHRDFIRVTEYKSAVLLGLILQFSVMPLTAVLISQLFSLPSELMIGMLLVGTVAGGTASNVMAFLAQGNVALSVTMTAVSTLVSVALTPLLMLWLAGSQVDVPALDMLRSLAVIILIPVALGVIVNSLAATTINKIVPALAPLAMWAIASIIAIVVALNADKIASINPLFILAPLLHNLIGLTAGYQVAKLLRYEPAICRTIALEVGMQNSGLATALALKFFTPLAAVPGAIFSVWLNLTGAVFAARVSKKE